MFFCSDDLKKFLNHFAILQIRNFWPFLSTTIKSFCDIWESVLQKHDKQMDTTQKI